MIKLISTKDAPAAIGSYSQAIIANKLIFCSGQIGIDPTTGNLVDGLEKQATQVLNNLKAVLDQAGSGLHKVVKTTVFLKNINDFPKMNEIYGEFFGNHKPARATVEVSNLPKGALVEIEAIAIISK